MSTSPSPGSGALLRNALRKHVPPALSAIGFQGKSNNLIRLDERYQDLLAIQYSKYGGSFILEFGRRERGPLHTSWGPVILEEDLDVAYLLISDRARLQESEGLAEDIFGGFHFATFGTDSAWYETLALRVASCLPQMDDWLIRREVGPNIFPYSQVGST